MAKRQHNSRTDLSGERYLFEHPRHLRILRHQFRAANVASGQSAGTGQVGRQRWVSVNYWGLTHPRKTICMFSF